MENNNDLKKLINRILVTTIIFGGVYLAYEYYNKSKESSFESLDHSFTVTDTISLRTNEALLHEIIVTYDVRVYPSVMDDKLKDIFKNQKDFYINHSFVYPVREFVKMEVYKNVQIKSDSLDESLYQFKEVVSNSIGKIVYDELKAVRKDIVITSFAFQLNLDPYLLNIVKKRLEYAKLVQENLRIIQEAKNKVKQLQSNVK